jgi:hypothetical protein
MTAYEMCPERWFALKDKWLQREQKILEGNTRRATNQFKSRRCQKGKCTYYELRENLILFVVLNKLKSRHLLLIFFLDDL